MPVINPVRVPHCPDGTEACRVIREAATEGEVVRALTEYLESLHPMAVAAIPANLLSLHLTHAKDIMGAAVILARHEAKMAHDTPESAIVKDVSSVLTAAATRLAVLQIKPRH
jgi:hypothetical protein